MNDLTETTTMKKKDVDRDEEQEELKYLLESVVVPNTPGTARQLGKEKVEYLGTMLLIRPEALDDYNAIDELPDELWEWARTMLLVTIIQRLASHSVLMDELAGSYHAKRITVNMLCDSACHYLLTLLGIAQQGQFTRESIGYVPYLDPQTWKRQEVSVSITTQIVHSPLLLPGGQRVPYLRNDLLIIYRGEQQRFSLDLPFI